MSSMSQTAPSYKHWLHYVDDGRPPGPSGRTIAGEPKVWQCSGSRSTALGREVLKRAGGGSISRMCSLGASESTGIVSWMTGCNRRHGQTLARCSALVGVGHI